MSDWETYIFIIAGMSSLLGSSSSTGSAGSAVSSKSLLKTAVGATAERFREGTCLKKY